MNNLVEVKEDGRLRRASLLWLFAVVVALSIFSAGSVFAEMNGMTHDGHDKKDVKHTKDVKTTKTVDGLVATIKVYPKVIDLILADAETKELIKGAEVEATVVYANGHKVVKNLVGMKMGQGYSYMNSMDMSAKGNYTIYLMINRDGKVIHTEFTGEVK